MKLAQWEPYRDMEQLLARMTPANFWSASRALPEVANARFQWTPAADISETEKEYLIRAELPAVRKEDVQVTLEDGTITIRGERKQRQMEKSEKFHRVESYSGEFIRIFSLPGDAEAAAVHADSSDGVLTVHIPKRAVNRPAPVQIKVE